LFLCLAPFLWGKVSNLSAGPLLSACCDGSLFVLQFCRAVWLWLLLTGSRDELCGLLPALLQAVAYPLHAISLPAFPAICLLIVHVEISSLLLPLFWCTFSILAHTPVCYFSFHCLFSFGLFCVWGSQSAQWSMLVYPKGGWGNTVFTCLVWSAECLLSMFGGGTLPRQQPTCNMAWSLPVLQSMGSGCWSFDSPWCFISTKHSSSISARFFIHGAHTVCFCTPVAILDLSTFILYRMFFSLFSVIS
jgi:hypothetical protein